MGDSRSSRKPIRFALLSHGNHSLDGLEDKIRQMARMCQVSEDMIEDAYPCSPMQEALMAASAESNNNSYMLQMVCSLGAKIDPREFQRAWKETARACPIMRTRIIYLEPYGAIQVVIDEDSKWSTGSSLHDYQKDDVNLPMTFGDILWRFAIIQTKNVSGMLEYFFVWTVHHAVCDGFSVPETLKRVALCYKKQPLPEQQPFYSFIEFVKSVDSAKAQAYWEKELRNCSSIPFPAIPDLGFRAFPSSLFTRQISFNQPEGLTLPKAIILQSAWALLLSNITGSTEVTFGSISSGRSAPVPGIREMNGPTITVVPLKVRVDQAQSVAEFFQLGVARAKEMIPYEHAGLKNIRRYLGEEGSRACDFQNLLVIQPGAFTKRATETMQLLGMNVLEKSWKNETHSYPLTTTITYTSGGLKMQMEYDSRVLHKRQVHNISNQYEEILHRLCAADLSAPISSISAFASEDKSQVYEWNQHVASLQDTCVHDLIQDRVRSSPDKIAICSWDGSLTYSELDSISSGLAARLMLLGVGPEIPVALCSEKSIWAPVALLAIHKSGGAYVPVDPSHPRERLQEIFSAANMNMALSSRAQVDALQGLCPHIIVLGAETVYELPKIQSSLRARPCNTAYIIFTSGSTGKPKGVVMQHSALCTSIIQHGKRLGFSPDWRTLQFSSHTFDVSIAEILTTLVFGGCVCIPSDHQRMNDIGQAIRNLKVNVALLTPTAASLIKPKEVPSLHTLILGGESITRENINRWASHVHLYNAFGPTEACIYCSIVEVSAKSDETNIGTAVGGNTWIVNPENHDFLVPIGCTGELVVSGPTLARGYSNNSAETEAVFVPSPRWLIDAGHSSSRIYKTGDLVRYDHDGAMHFVGRKDAQVKVRGFRIELEEVEAHISKVSETGRLLAVVPRSGLCREKIVVVACLKAHNFAERPTSTLELASEFTESKLDDWIDETCRRVSTKVPGYMVPSVWAVLEYIPIMSSGKLDRKAVIAWVESMSESTYRLCSRYVGPKNSVEFRPGSLIYKVKLALSEVLNVSAEDIGPKTSFMSLGGDSISAIQLVARCRKIGIILSVQDILRHKTLENLERVITPAQYTQEIPDFCPSEKLFELSPIQLAFLSLNESVVETERYNQGFMLKLQQRISPDDLRLAFDAIVRKHPMLRARFVRVEAGWQQQILEFSPDSYRLRIWNISAPKQIVSKIEESSSSINIIHGPVLSLDFFDTESDQRLFLVAHHLVVDLVSWRIILQDLEDFVKTRRLSPYSGISFFAWSGALKQKFTKNAILDLGLVSTLGIDYSFWGISNLENTYRHVEKLRWDLDTGSTTALLRPDARAARTEPIDFMISALGFSFAQAFADRDCPPIFVEGHGREPWIQELDLSSTVGWFTVLYPITGFPSMERGSNAFLEHVCDSRKQYPDNGLEHFSHKMLGGSNADVFPAHIFREVQFNYEGRYQQLENKSALFNLEENGSFESSLIGGRICRNAIFEVEATVRNQCLEFSLAFHQKILHQDRISQWFYGTKTVLAEMLRESSSEKPQPALGALSFYPFSTPELLRYDKLLHTHFGPNCDIAIEDVYLCSSFQEYMLKSQFKDASTFKVKWAIELSNSSGAPIHTADLGKAWRRVVQRHSILRTIFLFDGKNNSEPIQVVLRNPETPITTLDTFHPAEGEQSLHLCGGKPSIPHHLSILSTGGGTVKCIFEASHTVLDGWSLRILMRDFLAAYQNTLSMTPAPPFNLFTALLEPSRVQADNAYWHRILQHQEPCLLLPSVPQQDESPPGERFSIASWPPFPIASFSRMSTDYGLTIAAIIDAVWAKNLASIMNISSVSFAYLVSGREHSLAEALQIVGPMINLLAYHFPHVDATLPIQNLAIELQKQKIKDADHAMCGINDVVDALGRGRLWNTGVNYQRLSDKVVDANGDDLRIKELEWTDPWNVSIALVPPTTFQGLISIA